MESYKKNEYLPFPWNDEMYNDTELGIFYRLMSVWFSANI